MGLSGGVVVAVDDARRSAAALRWGAEEARREGRPLILLHAAGHLPQQLSYAERHHLRPALRAAGLQVLAEAGRVVRDAVRDVPVRDMLRLTELRAVLAEVRRDAHLVVVGPETWAATAPDLVGQLSGLPARRSPAPVVVLGRPSASLDGHVLAATATSVPPADVLDFAYADASRRRVDLEVLLPRDDPADSGAWLGQGVRAVPSSVHAEDVARCLARLRDAHAGAVPHPTRVTVSTVGTGRDLLARSSVAAVAVLGSGHVAAGRRPGTPDLGVQLVQRMRCPVAVVTGHPAVA